MLSSGRFALRRYQPARGRGLRKIDLASALMVYADVAIETTTRELGNRLFTYVVPDHLRDEVFVGSQVLVPFGHQELVCGYVMSLRDSMSATGSEEQPEFRVKLIVETMESEPLFDPSYVSLLHWVSEYYSASILDVINAAIPSDVGTRVKRVVRLLEENGEVNGEDDKDSANDGATLLLPFMDGTAMQGSGGGGGGSVKATSLNGEQQAITALLRSAKGGAMPLKTLRQRSSISQSRFYGAISRLRQGGVISVERETDTKLGAKVVHTVMWTGVEAQTKKQEHVVNTLRRGGGQMTVPKLSEAAGTTSSTIKRMCVAGVLRMVEDEVIRDPLSHLSRSDGDAKKPELTDQQKVVLATLSAQLTELLDAPRPTLQQAMEAESVRPWLLHGVTGSGKTEIYLRLIEIALRYQRSVLMLVPEISLTPQLAQRLVERFGDLVAVWHSGLSPGERFDTWRRLKAGQAKVLLGARSAVLANIPDVGLIILDEEHDSSYKQSSPSPRYHAKNVALERAKRNGALVVLGSATPDVATYYECRQTKQIVELPERVFKQALPKSVLVDMRMEFQAQNRSVFSRLLQEEVSAALGRKEQIILLINRRGYASHVFCKACGFVMKCRNCSVSLVFHQEPSGAPGATNSGAASQGSGAPSRIAPYQPPKNREGEIRGSHGSIQRPSADGSSASSKSAAPELRGSHGLYQPANSQDGYNKGYGQNSDRRGSHGSSGNYANSRQGDSPGGGSMGGSKKTQSPLIEGYLICHHCAYSTDTCQFCPSCKSPFIRQFGLGTQRVEEEVRGLFPFARMLRLDSDITSKRGASEEVFTKFAAGEADILIGTQIVAKGLDVAKVTLVGVLAADASFNLPDYRSQERGFQLLTQVSGRAGRGHHAGKVILQTYNLDLPSLSLARKQDYATFYERELIERQSFEYPPFSQIIRVVIAGDVLSEVEYACEQLAEELSNYLEDKFDEEQIKILGPAPCLIERLRNKYRYHLLIKNLVGDEGRKVVTQFLRQRRGWAGLTMAVDVDAVDLL